MRSSTSFIATICDVERGIFRTGQRFLRITYQTNGYRDHAWIRFSKVRQREDITPRHMRELYDDLAERGVPVKIEVKNKMLIGTLPLNSNSESDGFHPPPPRTYSCHECGKPFRDTDLSTVERVIETGTGCYREAIHPKCEDGPIGTF